MNMNVYYMDQALECRKKAMEFLIKSLEVNSPKLRERYELDSKWYNKRADEFVVKADLEMIFS